MRGQHPAWAVLRDRRDRWPLLFAAMHGAVLGLQPPWWVIAACLWWTANTVAHQATHRRFFRGRRAEAAWGLWLSLLLGVPQRLWQQRHLAHHAGRPVRLRLDVALRAQAVLLAAGALALAATAPAFLLAAWLPGQAAGLLLCALHGRGEHLAGATHSIYAPWWNRLFCNDGYHVEHHRWPRAHYRDLPARRVGAASQSRLPPPLRALALPWRDGLDGLERLVLRVAALQRLVLALHRPAFVRLLAALPAPPRRVVVVGGGLFPRSALLLKELLPHAAITIVDSDAAHLERARRLLPAGIRVRQATFTPGDVLDADLVVLPLALRGDRARCYAAPAAPAVLVHDWLWRRPAPPGRGVAVPWLCKRVNLVLRAAADLRQAS